MNLVYKLRKKLALALRAASFRLYPKTVTTRDLGRAYIAVAPDPELLREELRKRLNNPHH